MPDKETSVIQFIVEINHLKHKAKYWYRCFCIAMGLLGSTWGVLIGYMLFGH